MGMDYWEYEQEAAYSDMVDRIIEENRDEIIDQFISDRMAAYYLANPNITDPATASLHEAHAVLEVSPSAALIFACSSMEMMIRDVFLKPLALGMIHNEAIAPLMGPLLAPSNQLNTLSRKLLFALLKEHGFDINEAYGSRKRAAWAEIEELKGTRNKVIHHGQKATAEEAGLAMRYAKFLINSVYPHIKGVTTP